MKSSISTFALSLVLLSTSASFTSAVPAPLPAATGYTSNTEEAALVAEARAQLRPVWRPGPHLDESSTPTASPSSNNNNNNKLSARQGPVFRRNAESKFQYRKRTSAGLAVVGNLAYGLNEREIASPFGIGIGNGDNHVPLPVQMRVRREASLLERDDDEEEDWDCSEYDDDEDEDEQYDDGTDDQAEQWSAPASSSETPAPPSSSEPPKEKPSQSSSSSSTPAAPAASNDSSNAKANAAKPLLTNNVIGTKKDDSQPGSQAEPDSPDAAESESPAPSPSPASFSASEQEVETTPESAAYIAPAPQTTEYTSEVYQVASTQKASLKKTHKTHSKSKSSKKTKTKPLEPKLTTPADVAPGTLTVEQGCTRYHTVVSGEVCLGLLDWSKDLDLTLEQLYSYNPAIDSECMNLQIGWGVCIGASPSNSTATTSTSLLKKRNFQLRL